MAISQQAVCCSWRLTIANVGNYQVYVQGTAAGAGSYQVYARWPVSTVLATDAKYKLTTPTNISTVTVNQRQGGGTWHLLGNVTLAANDNWRVDLSDQASGSVAADAVAVVPSGVADSFTWTPDLPGAGTYQVFASWSAASDRARDASYQIHSTGGVTTVSVDQSQPTNGWRYLGSYDFDPANAPSISLLSSLTGSVSADALRFVGSGNMAGVSFILSDQIGQPQKLTDENGSLVWDRVSTPYGETVDLQNPGNVDQLLRFPGQQLDPTTSLAYNYYRDYDASLGRYIQSDPIGLNGGINTYAYVGGNPVNRVDPYGEDCTAANGQVTCSTPYGTLPPFSQPAGWPTTMNSDSEFHHTYDIKVPLNGANKDCVMSGMINNPTPGSPSPATPQGTGNNATPTPAQNLFDAADYVSSFGSDSGGYNNSPVTSYVMNLNGSQVVVNVTLPGHPLFPGYVVRSIQGSNVSNYGEGNGWLQSSWSPFSSLINGVWNGQSKGITSNCGCQE